MICFETVAVGLEFNTELRMIVYFAVKGDHQLLIESGHRLRTSGDIEDRQTPMPKKNSGILIDPGAFAIRTTMRKRVDHPMQNCAFSGSYKSSNTAHGERSA